MPTWPKKTYEFGPPSNPRRVNFYGHFKRGEAAKKHRINLLHAEALEVDAARDAFRHVLEYVYESS